MIGKLTRGGLRGPNNTTGSWQGALIKLVQEIQIGLRTKASQSQLVRNSCEEQRSRGVYS